MEKIQLSNEIIKRLSKENYYNQDDLISDIKCYIKAVKSGRILYNVMNVSKSGMSRNILIQSFEGKITKGYYRQYGRMFEVLGYKVNKWNEVTVSGCGMNMLFATNYYLIKSFHKMGFITKKECETLAQKVN